MNHVFTESVGEEAALAHVEASRWRIAHGPDGRMPEPPEAR
mgnify:CR=1 FL=1